MEREELLARFWDATLDGDEIDYDAFLAEGGEELREAVEAHRVLRRAAESWRRPERPRQLGRFEVLSDLGAGGLGRVYLGWDPELRRHVAIKVIARDRWAINEARAIAQLDHRSVVKVYEVGPDRLVMELLDGGSLQEHVGAMAAGEPSPLDGLRARLHCLVRIAEGLAYCHERGILHRDVKPGNVLFAKDDEHPRLVDFGLAHLDELESLDITQNLVGSPAYLAPEQVESGETGTDSRSDIFSFGVLAYELLTLECPFKRETRTATLEAVTQASPRALRSISAEVPRAVEHIVQHCLELDPRDRYQAMSDVVADLQNVLADRPISVGGQSAAHRAKLLYQRNRRVTWFASAGAGLTVLVACMMWTRGAHAERAEFASELHAIERSLPLYDDVFEFMDAAWFLGGALVRAEGLDDEALGRALYGPLRPRTEELVERWSKRLGEVVSAIEADATSGRRTDAWKSVFQIDQNLLPDADWNREFRNRGRLVLADDLTQRDDLVLLRQEYRGPNMETGWIVFREAEFEEFPSSGYYRASLPGEWDREFLVTSIWQEEIRLEQTERRLSTGGWLDLPERGLVASPLITNGQYRVFHEDTHRAHTLRKTLVESAPFVGCWRDMQAYAIWAGGRLPSMEEVAALALRYGTSESDTFGGEYVSDTYHLETLDMVWIAVYEYLADAPGAPPKAWSEETTRDNSFTLGKRRFGFRVIYHEPSD